MDVVGFGKHSSKSLESLIVAEPDYTMWLLKEGTSGPAAKAKTKIIALLKKLDSKGFVEKCRRCNSQATRGSLYRGAWGDSPYWWCDTCDPYSSGAYSGKLYIIKSYSDVVSAVTWNNGTKSDLKAAVRSLVGAKGATGRLTKHELSKLFK